PGCAGNARTAPPHRPAAAARSAPPCPTRPPPVARSRLPIRSVPAPSALLRFPFVGQVDELVPPHHGDGAAHLDDAHRLPRLNHLGGVEGTRTPQLAADPD